MVVVADSGDVCYVLVGICDGRSALDRQQVAEAQRRETGNELYPEYIALLDFDVQPRSGQNVVRDETEIVQVTNADARNDVCLLYTSPSPRDGLLSRMPSSA